MNILWVWPIAVHKVEKLAQLPGDAIVLAVNDKPCIGRCKACGKPITVEDSYETWEHEGTGYPVCQDCADIQESYGRLEQFRSAENV
jgi:hypothetical protein